jgi:hypothetical protein
LVAASPVQKPGTKADPGALRRWRVSPLDVR